MSKIYIALAPYLTSRTFDLYGACTKGISAQCNETMDIVNLIAIKRQFVSYVLQLDWQMRKQMGRYFFVAAGDKFATVPNRTSEILPGGCIDHCIDRCIVILKPQSSRADLGRCFCVHPMGMYSDMIQFRWLKIATLDRAGVDSVRVVRLFDVLCQSLGFLELGGRFALETPHSIAAVHCFSMLCLEMFIEPSSGGESESGFQGLRSVRPLGLDASPAREATGRLLFRHRLELGV
jgi:hypothetical protein